MHHKMAIVCIISLSCVLPVIVAERIVVGVKHLGFKRTLSETAKEPAVATLNGKPIPRGTVYLRKIAFSLPEFGKEGFLNASVASDLTRAFNFFEGVHLIDNHGAPDLTDVQITVRAWVPGLHVSFSFNQMKLGAQLLQWKYPSPVGSESEFLKKMNDPATRTAFVTFAEAVQRAEQGEEEYDAAVVIAMRTMRGLATSAMAKDPTTAFSMADIATQEIARLMTSESLMEFVENSHTPETEATEVLTDRFVEMLVNEYNRQQNTALYTRLKEEIASRYTSVVESVVSLGAGQTLEDELEEAYEDQKVDTATTSNIISLLAVETLCNFLQLLDTGFHYLANA